MNFGEKLTDLRKQKGLSQEELGEKLNVNRQTLSKWELGQTSPDTGKLTEIANYFNVGVNELTNKEEIKYNDSPINEKENNKSVGIIILIIILVLCLVGIVFYTTTLALGKSVFNKAFGLINKAEEVQDESEGLLNNLFGTIKNEAEKQMKENEEFNNEFMEMKNEILNEYNRVNEDIKNSTEKNKQEKSTRTEEEIQKEIDELNEELIPLRLKQDEELKSKGKFTEEWYRLNNEIQKIQSQISKLNVELWKAQYSN